MDTPYDEFQRRLLAMFSTEAHEHLHAMTAGLIELEHASGPSRQAEIVETIFREVHSLKGAAHAVNLAPIGTVCQAVESVFAALKRQEIAVSAPLLDVLHHAIGAFQHLLAATEAPADAPPRRRITALVHSLESMAQSNFSPPAPGAVPGTEGAAEPVGSEPEAAALPASLPPLTETVRVSTARLASVLLQTEELLSVKWTSQQRAVKLRETRAALAAWHKMWARLRPEVREVRQFCESETVRNGTGTIQGPVRRLLEFVDWSRDTLRALEAELMALQRATEHEQHTFGAMIDHLLDDTKKVLMQPFVTLLEGFPPVVRELSRAQGKDVELLIDGGGSEIDRRILEEMKDPLMHLLRNCLDHGIELPLERERRRKPPRGRITIAIAQKDARSVALRIADDGAGIDAATVTAAAVQMGLLTSEEASRLRPHDAVSLVFQSGVSTSPMLTDISGRGLGLAIVREKVEKLGGTITIATQPTLGTAFSIVLPLTLATFRGLLVRVYDRLFILPVTAVDRVVRIRQEAIQTVGNRETIILHGHPMALIRLAEVLELPRQNAPPAAASAPAVVLSAAVQRMAFLVDEVLQEQEILVKSLGRQLSRVRNIAGATVLVTGKVVPILHVPDLLLSAVRVNAARIGPTTVPEARSTVPPHAVLVAEDSITSRVLLKNILESAGYEVDTAVDGLDALTRLRHRAFAIVVSDVDMPRLNGFDLTAQIRHDQQLAHLPVVLVTSLDSRADRERGIEVGANAYIVKSSFDQSNLLDVMRRLL